MILVREKYTVIKNFTIFGERHSGTNFLQKTIESSFEIPVCWDYGWKHFFGFTNNKIIKSKNTLFIGIVRNPYDWLFAMKQKPYHIPNKNIVSSIGFLTNEWYSEESGKKEIFNDRNYLNNKRYKNIFEMRKSKILYLIDTMPILSNNYIFFRYEDFLENNKGILKNISHKYSLSLNHKTKIDIQNKVPYTMPKTLKEIIDNNCDWDIEKRIGYSKK